MRRYVEESCKNYPDAVALVLDQRSWTYAEIDDTARRWASRLLDATGGHPSRIGVLGYRSETSYLGTLASLFAGAAFVPLNPRFPVRRTRAMIEMAELDALLVDSASISQVQDLTTGLSRPPAVLSPGVLAADALCDVMFDRNAMADAQPLAALPAISPGDMAYLLFTSGSTGVPKGVPITHANVTSFLDTNLKRYEIGPNDRLSQTFDQTFDLSIFDLFMAWASGARVCAMQPIQLVAPASFINKHGVTVWFSVPSIAIMMQKNKLLKPNTMPSLRWSLFCGESLPLATAEAWQQAAPNSIVENLYGPTELTIACSAYRWDPDRSPGESAQGLVSIGPMYPGLFAQLINDELQPVSDGQPGELCVAGPQTFPGYWRAPDLTDMCTVVLNGTDSRHERYYRTGDMMRRLPNGNYAFLGRCDHQIKLRGYRIELSEIEAALRRAGCIEAVVLPFPGTHHPEAIVAFVSGVTNTSGLADDLRELLPSYMVPNSIHSLELMPLNANGKIDRHALSQMIEDDRFAISSPTSQPDK
jgi:amino acid adenylation domain-containing protein